MTESQMPRPDEAALSVLRRLRQAGHESYFCGGCVRDALLGREPGDWDITTAARPEEVEALFEHTVPVGKAFGVMLVVVGTNRYEVATFRADSPASDGRRPEEVRFCSAREDVRRRDFTVNALLYDPQADRVLDYVDGLADLRAGRIRAVGPARERFLEDYLRILRAVRFAATLGFDLEEKTAAAVAGCARLVTLVAAERIGEEMQKMLTRGGAGRGLRLLDAGRLLTALLPEVAAMAGTPQPEAFHPEGDVFVHTALMLDALPAEADAELAWAVLLHDVGKPPTISVRERIRFDNHPDTGAEMAEAILRRLKRPGMLIETACTLVRDHMRLTSLFEMRQARRRRWLRWELFGKLLELHRLDCVASHGKMDLYDRAKAAWEEELATPEPPEPILRGGDLIEMGYSPGPQFGEILDAVEDARLEGRVTTPYEAKRYVREHFS
jgi:poly(A) polymerase